MARDDSSIFRKVYFFKVEHFAEIRETLPNALNRILTLDFNDTGRYKLELPSRVRYSAYPDSCEYPIKLRFGKIRRNSLPEIEHAGNLDTLELKEDAGLIDISHVVIFGDGFVAAEWNPDGPKLSMLGTYIYEKGRLNTAPKFNNLVERDIVETLRKLVSVRVVEIDVPPDALALARQADANLATAIQATSALGATKKTAFVLAAEKPARPLRDLAVRLATLIKSSPQEGELINSFSVQGYSEGSRKAKYIDVLESKLMTAESFSKTNERSRSLKTADAYKTLEALYQQNLDRIRVAASTSDMP